MTALPIDTTTNPWQPAPARSLPGIAALRLETAVLTKALTTLKNLLMLSQADAKGYCLWLTSSDGRYVAVMALPKDGNHINETSAMIRLPILASSKGKIRLTAGFDELHHALAAFDAASILDITAAKADTALMLNADDGRCALLPQAPDATGDGRDMRDYLPTLLRNPGPYLQMTAEALRLALWQAAPAMGREDIRYYLTGAVLESSRNSTSITATDGHRLHHAPLNRLSAHGVMQNAIIPNTIVKGLLAHLKTTPPRQPITVMVEGTDLMIGCADWWIAGHRIDGTFPDYARIMPDITRPHTRLTINAEAWTTLVGKALKTFRRGTSLSLRLEFEPGSRAVSLIVKPDASSSVTEITIALPLLAAARIHSPERPAASKKAAEQGEKTDLCQTVGMNAKYLHATLASITGTCEIAILSDQDPLTFLPAAGGRRLVMPMRL